MTSTLRISGSSYNAMINARNFMNNNSFDFGDAVTFDIADLREAMQIQRFLEINARSGSRWNEFLRGQFDQALLIRLCNSQSLSVDVLYLL